MRDHQDEDLLRSAAVVGLTTSGLADKQTLIASLAPKVRGLLPRDYCVSFAYAASCPLVIVSLEPELMFYCIRVLCCVCHDGVPTPQWTLLLSQPVSIVDTCMIHMSRDVILALQIVVVEEAAEILEAHTLAGLPPSVEHFLQIGRY